MTGDHRRPRCVRHPSEERNSDTKVRGCGDEAPIRSGEIGARARRSGSVRRSGALARGWRGAFGLPAGVLAVHQLRYLLAYGARAGHELTAHGDTYVGVAVPLVIVALGVPVAAVLSRLTRAWSGDDGAGEGRRRWWSLWLTATVL
jgi:hypothetical protein